MTLQQTELMHKYQAKFDGEGVPGRRDMSELVDYLGRATGIKLSLEPGEGMAAALFADSGLPTRYMNIPIKCNGGTWTVTEETGQ